MNYEIGKHLKVLRLERGLTQEELARLARVAPSSVNHAETGARLSFRMVAKLASVFGLTLGLYAQPEVLSLEERELIRAYRANDLEALISIIASRRK